MKKFISFITASIMMILFAAAPVSAAYSDTDISLLAEEEHTGAIRLVSSKNDVASGDTFTVTAEVTEPFTAAAAQVQFGYDTSSLTLESMTKGLIDVDEFTEGRIRGYREAITDIQYEGTLYSATFKVKSGAEAANLKFTFAQSQFTAANGVMIVPSTASVTVKVNGGKEEPTPKPTATPTPRPLKTPTVTYDNREVSEYFDKAELSGYDGAVTVTLSLADGKTLDEGKCVMIRTYLNDDTDSSGNAEVLFSADMWNGEGSGFVRRLSVPDGRYIKSAKASIVSGYAVFPYFTATVTGGTGIKNVTLVCGEDTPLTTEAEDNVYTFTNAEKGKTYDVNVEYETGYKQKSGEAKKTVTKDSPTAAIEAEAKQYAVKYNMQGHGTAIDDGTYTYASGSLTLAEPAEVTGYTFDGWYSGSDADAVKIETADAFEKLITDNEMTEVTLYAKWTPNTYGIEYVLGEGSNPDDAPTSFVYDTAPTLPTPAREGWTFVGWYDGSGDDARQITGETIKSLVTDNSVEKVTLYARWIENPKMTAIEKAPISDFVTGASESELAEEYKITVDGSDIKVTAQSLKQHKNAESQDGYWAGVRFTPANMTEHAKVYYMALAAAPADAEALKTTQGVSSVELTADDLTNGWSVYSDASLYQSGKDRYGWRVYVAFDGIDTLYSIDFSDVTLYQPPTAELSAATLHDTSDIISDEELFDENNAPTIGAAEGIYIPVTINTKGIKKHTNGNDAEGYWTGVKLVLANVTDDTTIYIGNADTAPADIEGIKTTLNPLRLGDIKDKDTESTLSVYDDASLYLSGGSKVGRFLYIYVDGMEQAYKIDFSSVTLYEEPKAAITGIVKASIVDSETGQTESDLAVNYSIDITELPLIKVKADSLKSHKNGDAEPNDGYWAGVTFTFENMAEDAKVYCAALSAAPSDAAALKANEAVSGEVLTEDDLANGWSVYSNAARYKSDGDRDGWKVYVAFDGIDTLYSIDFSGVTLYSDADGDDAAGGDETADGDSILSDGSLQSVLFDNETNTENSGADSGNASDSNTEGEGGGADAEEPDRSYVTAMEIVKYKDASAGISDGYYAHLTFTDVDAADNVSDSIMFAFYDSDNRLVGINICGISDLTDKSEWITYIASYDESNGNGLRVKSFIWDGFGNMKPLANTQTEAYAG